VDVGGPESIQEGDGAAVLQFQSVDSGQVVCQGVEPNVHNVLIIKPLRYGYALNKQAMRKKSENGS